MNTRNVRAHGVTPSLSQDYVKRTATHQAAFILPFLHSGMNLLDVGCGPGTITMGLAQVAAPGQVIGVDHDWQHIEMARKLALENEVDNITFQNGDALSLPFDDNTFDAAFENNVFVHLSENAGIAAGEVFRVLKPHGLFAARDADADSVVWGNSTDSLKQFDKLFIAWHRSRGSDITLGKQLPTILRQAGFVDMIKSVSADTKGSPKDTRAHAEITISLLDGPFGKKILKNGWADKSTIERWKTDFQEWSEHPDSFFANIHVEVVGWKPA